MNKYFPNTVTNKSLSWVRLEGTHERESVTNLIFLTNQIVGGHKDIFLLVP